MICPRRLFTRPKAEREDGAASGWGHSRACPELVEGLPLKLSPNLFVKSPHIESRSDPRSVSRYEIIWDTAHQCYNFLYLETCDNGTRTVR